MAYLDVDSGRTLPVIPANVTTESGQPYQRFRGKPSNLSYRAGDGGSRPQIVLDAFDGMLTADAVGTESERSGQDREPRLGQRTQRHQHRIALSSRWRQGGRR